MSDISGTLSNLAKQLGLVILEMEPFAPAHTTLLAQRIKDQLDALSRQTSIDRDNQDDPDGGQRDS